MDKASRVSECPSTQCGLFAVIVLYRTAIDNAVAFTTLRQALFPVVLAGKDFGALLFDNTPSAVAPVSLPVGFQYESVGTNLGLPAAYNRAVDLAQKHNSSWLLLLDQDTRLPADFLQLLSAEIEKYDVDQNIAAIAPIVRSGKAVISPKRVDAWQLRALPAGAQGVQNEEITCINSGTAVRCSFVRSIGGFNRAYWLDYLDYWLFRKIYATGKKVAIFDSTLEHDLSVTDYTRNVSNERYRSILNGESAFMTTYRPKSQVPFYLFRLLFRSVRLALQRQLRMALFTLSVIGKIALHPTRSLEDGS